MTAAPATCPLCAAPVDAEPLAAVAARCKPLMRRILAALETGDIVPSYRLAERVWCADPDGGPDTAANAIAVAIHAHREILFAGGWTIPRFAQVRGYGLVTGGLRRHRQGCPCCGAEIAQPASVQMLQHVVTPGMAQILDALRRSPMALTSAALADRTCLADRSCVRTTINRERALAARYGWTVVTIGGRGGGYTLRIGDT